MERDIISCLLMTLAYAYACFRFHLDVAQEPIHGRRKTEKDRRPLAHCPIVRLRVKECRRITDASPYNRERDDYEQGWEETEVDMSYVRF